MIDLVEDCDSRTLIAPPLTSLETAMVISNLGTSGRQEGGKEIILSEVRQTLGDTHAHKESETLESGREVSAHNDTNTTLLAQIAALQ